MLAHSFDRFYVVTKFTLPSIGDLNFSTLNYYNTCTYLYNKNMHNTDSKKHMLDHMTFCKKIESFLLYYKRLIKSYNNMAHNILENEINFILSQIPRKQKHGIITTLVSSFIGLAYEGISSFLRVSDWNKSSEFTLLTFTTFVPRPKKVKKFFKIFGHCPDTPPGH